jgi:hypothetical protein
MQYGSHSLMQLLGTFAQLLPVVLALAFFLLPLFLLALPWERRWVKILGLLAGIGSVIIIGAAALVVNGLVRPTADWEYLVELLLASPPVSVCLLIFSLPLYFVKLPSKRWWAKLLAGMSTILSFVAVGLLALIVDMSLPVPHSLVFCAVFITLAAAANLPLALRFRSKTCFALLAIFSIMVVAGNLGDFTREKSFKRFYASIQPGMSKQEVQTAMQKEFSASHFPPPEYSEGTTPGTADMQYTLTDTPGEFGPWSALLMVKLADGKVAAKSYENN